MQAGSFDEATFAREKENLDHYLASLDDDRQTQAALGVQQLYFGADQDQAIPSFGTREDLGIATASSLAAYYQEMMQHDQVIITVLGDVILSKWQHYLLIGHLMLGHKPYQQWRLIYRRIQMCWTKQRR